MGIFALLFTPERILSKTATVINPELVGIVIIPVTGSEDEWVTVKFTLNGEL